MRRALAALLLCAAPSCLYVATDATLGPRLDPEAVARIVPSETTKAEVLDLLGPPDEFVRSEVLDSLLDDEARLSGALRVGNRAQDAFTWQRERLRGRGTYLILFGKVGVTVESDLLLVLFDESDVVREVSFRTREER